MTTQKSKLSSQEIEVTALLLRGRFKVECQYLGFNHSRNSDEWLYTISNENHSRVERFNYFTGIGHRFIKASSVKYPYPCYSVKHLTNDCKRSLQNYQRSYELKNKSRLYNTQLTVMQPEIAGLLYSLLLDIEADNMSFSNWCNELGYNDDSIKHFNIYQDCCKESKQWKNIFNSVITAEFKKILEDY